MDGRENPTSSGTHENSTQGGIFSSPDLTVNTENVPTLGGGREVSEGEVSGGNAERIAAAFSQTDATRQKAATAAAMQQTPLVTPIPSTATEDIQLPGEKKKRSKLPFVIGLVVLVVAVAVGGWWMVRGMGGKETTLAAFESYYNYLTSGSSDENHDAITDTNSWAFVKMSSGTYANSDTDEYFTELNRRYADFVQIAQRNNSTTILKNLETSSYTQILDLITHNSTLDTLRQRLLDTYLSGGQSSARTFIDDLNITGSDLKVLSRANDALTGYLEDELTLIVMNDGWGCIVNGKLDPSCNESFTEGNAEYAEISMNQQRLRKNLNGYAATLQAPLLQETLQLSQVLQEGA